MMQTEAQHGQIDGLRGARNRIGALGTEASTNEHDHEHRNERDGEDGRGTDGERLGPSERAEHAARLRLEQKHGQKRNDNNEQRKEQCRANLFGRVNENPPALRLGDRVRCILMSLGEMPVTILDHNDRGIDQHADGERKTTERHDVRGHTEKIDGNEGDQHRNWKGENRNQRRAEVKEKNNDDQADNHDLFEQVALQRVNGSVNQAGAIIARHDFDACGK